MNVKFLLGIAALGLAASAYAAPITPEEALARLGNSSHKAASVVKGKAGAKLVHTAMTKSEKPAVYIFNKGEDNGYLVLPADDKAYAVLGYSDSGSFDAGNIPPQMEWWLSQYAEQIEYAAGKETDTRADAMMQATRAQREAIEPMCKTKWDQIPPYNNKCPMLGANRTYTGCVATSMAQVMNYFQYPEVGQGNISYESESLGKRLTLNFGLTKFDWANMCDTYKEGYYTEAEAEAVAVLMRAAGYAVKMDYAEDASGTLAMYISNGLVKYFGYDPNINYVIRACYPASEWEKMLYDNLHDVGPILYGGGSMIGGGHSFICDGYDGNGMFHFNWGWSGMSDGYFSLDALAPTALGAGGGGGGGYNFTQDAVIGIQPPTGKPVVEKPKNLIQMGSLSGDMVDKVLKFALFAESNAAWVNYNPSTLKLKFGAVVEEQGGAGTVAATYIDDQPFSLQPGYGTGPGDAYRFYPELDFGKLNLPDGTYKVTIAIEHESDPGNWIKVDHAYGYYNYLVVHKTGDTYTVDDQPIWILDLNYGKCTDSKLYYGCVGNFEIEVENDSDLEFSKGFAPVLFYEDVPFFLGESVFVTVAPHSKVVKKWATPLYALQQIAGISQTATFDLAFLDESTYNFYFMPEGNPLEFHPNPGVPTVDQMSLVIRNADSVMEEIIPGVQRSVYVVKDPLNMDVSSTLRTSKGIFAYNTLACVLEVDLTGGSQYAEIVTYAGHPIFMETGQRGTLRTTVSFPQGKPGPYYAMQVAYQYGSSFAPIGQSVFFRIDGEAPSGIGDIAAESADEPAGDDIYYNLQGIALGRDLNALPAGLYIHNGKKILKH